MDGGECIATHPRSYDKGQQIEDPQHIKELIQRKRAAREHRGKDRLAHACPSSRKLLEQAAQRGDNLGSIVSTLLRILDQYGATETEQAIIESLSRGVSHPNGVRQALERRREERERPTPIAIDLKKHPQAENIAVKPHDLSVYDQLQGEEEDEGEEKQ